MKRQLKMKVKFVRLRTPESGVDDSSFELGKVYLVFGIQFQPGGRSPLVTVQRDTDKTPVMRELQYFEVVDSTVPDEWCLFDFGGGVYRLEPKEFGGDFWDRFHDADEDAEKTFERVAEKINAASIPVHCRTACMTGKDQRSTN